MIKWRILNTPVNALVENFEKYVKTAVWFHNYLRQTENAAYCRSGFIDPRHSNGNIQPGYWRESLQSNRQPLLSNLQPVRGC